MFGVNQEPVNFATVQRRIQDSRLSAEEKKEFMGRLRDEKPESVLDAFEKSGMRRTMQGKIPVIRHKG